MAQMTLMTLPMILANLEGISAAENNAIEKMEAELLVEEAYKAGITMTPQLAEDEDLLLVDNLEEMVLQLGRKRTIEFLDQVTPLASPWEEISDVVIIASVNRIYDRMDTPEERQELLAQMRRWYKKARTSLQEWRDLRKQRKAAAEENPKETAEELEERLQESFAPWGAVFSVGRLTRRITYRTSAGTLSPVQVMDVAGKQWKQDAYEARLVE